MSSIFGSKRFVPLALWGRNAPKLANRQSPGTITFVPSMECAVCQDGVARAVCSRNGRKDVRTGADVCSRAINALRGGPVIGVITTCTCLPNWTGTNCDRLVNKCQHKPCKNGAQCTPVGVNGDFVRCICPPGFTGRDCGIPFANCKNAICPGQNQQCVPLEHGYTCACAPGFDGPNCDLSHQQQRRRQQQKQQQQIGHDEGAPMAPQDFHGLVTIGTCV
uniref:EGF-like domain-containing protein n=1 Tax=Globodera pallida TaxID=36090 RepID=A0A183CIP3_GLOPA